MFLFSIKLDCIWTKNSWPAICFLRMSISLFRLLISTSLLVLTGPSPVGCCNACTVWVDSATGQERDYSTICCPVKCQIAAWFYACKSFDKLTQAHGLNPQSNLAVCGSALVSPAPAGWSSSHRPQWPGCLPDCAGHPGPTGPDPPSPAPLSAVAGNPGRIEYYRGRKKSKLVKKKLWLRVMRIIPVSVRYFLRREREEKEMTKEAGEGNRKEKWWMTDRWGSVKSWKMGGREGMTVT